MLSVIQKMKMKYVLIWIAATKFKLYTIKSVIQTYFVQAIFIIESIGSVLLGEFPRFSLYFAKKNGQAPQWATDFTKFQVNKIRTHTFLSIY